MAPTRSKKRKSTESTTSVDIQNFPAPPQMVPTKVQSIEMTPTNRSPIKKAKINITIGQKQALIDNLQLEITERARKLRAQYVLQAQGLRTRIEIRVNRIPTALRKEKMGDLVLKYSDTAPKTTKTITAGPSRPQKASSPAKYPIQEAQPIPHGSPSFHRGTKRASDDISVDKENDDLSNPKKRARGAPIQATRTASRGQLEPSSVLSPRSANSRTLPRSPIRGVVSPPKSLLARPVSPLKPTAPVPSGGAAGILTGMAKTGRSTATARKPLEPSTGAGRGKRTAGMVAAPAPKVGRGRASTISDMSDGSSTTTIVRKQIAKDAATAKKGVIGTIKGMGSQKKMPVAVKSNAPVTGGRVLRKRN